MMFHSSVAWERYARMERLMDVESIGVLCAGAMIGAAGWLGREMEVVIAGAVIFIAGVITWSYRRVRLFRRRRETPKMILVSEEGINAILIDNSTVGIEWAGTSAHEFCYLRGGLPDNIYVADTAMRGMMLQDAHGQRLYLTQDLDGYEDILRILLELDVPIEVVSTNYVGSYGSFTYWRNNLERRAWEESEDMDMERD
jgi:hypothetical protein